LAFHRACNAPGGCSAHIMKILVDENIPSITVQELKRLGHETLDI
jgi:hypothetical protein